MPSPELKRRMGGGSYQDDNAGAEDIIRENDKF